jgi:hypothetical protein
MRTYALVFFIFPFFACAREMTVGQLPSPPYLDTEVWNLISVKRRGIGVANECVKVNETTRGLHLIVN